MSKLFESLSKEKNLVKINEELYIGSNNGLSRESQINKKQYGWVNSEGKYFLSKKPNSETIESGLYNIRHSDQYGYYLEQKSVTLDEIFLVPDTLLGEIVADMEKFWNNKQRYDDYKIVYKRGILLYGLPGTGKSSFINLLINEICSNYNGIAVNMESNGSFIQMAEVIRNMEPDIPILAIIEDLDSYLYNNSIKEFLNILDGNNQIGNVIYLATTNYIGNIEDRIKNRPSRFDRKYEIGYPNEIVRKYYLEKKLKPEDLAVIDIDKWVADTANMSFAHLKELVCSVVIMGSDYDKTMVELKNMVATD